MWRTARLTCKEVALEQLSGVPFRSGSFWTVFSHRNRNRNATVQNVELKQRVGGTWQRCPNLDQRIDLSRAFRYRKRRQSCKLVLNVSVVFHSRERRSFARLSEYSLGSLSFFPPHFNDPFLSPRLHAIQAIPIAVPNSLKKPIQSFWRIVLVSYELCSSLR